MENPIAKPNRSFPALYPKSPENTLDHSTSVRVFTKSVFRYARGRDKVFTRGRQTCEPHGEDVVGGWFVVLKMLFATEALASYGLTPSVSASAAQAAWLSRVARRGLFCTKVLPNGSLVERFLIPRAVACTGNGSYPTRGKV